MLNASFHALSTSFPLPVASAAPSDGASPRPRWDAAAGSATICYFNIPLGPALPHLGLTWVSPRRFVVVLAQPAGPPRACLSPWPVSGPSLLPSLAQSLFCCFLHISEPAPVPHAPGGPMLVAARAVAWLIKIWVFVCSSGTLFSPVPTFPMLHPRCLLNYLLK